MLVLLGVFGCYRASGTVRTAQEVSDELAEMGSTVRITPEIIAAQSACEHQHDLHACIQAAEAWEGEDGHPFDPKKSLHFAEIGCTGGDGLGCAILGNHYQNGLGVAWSPSRAIEFYERSCNAGTGLGCAGLGAMYAHGQGWMQTPQRPRPTAIEHMPHGWRHA